jgi:proliferating cell nuclear antigen
MSFTHGKSQQFKDLLEALNVLSEEIAFTANQDGLTATQMDPSHCAMFVLKMPCTAFERWDVTEEQKFSVNVTDLVKKILKNTYKDESVELSYDQDRARLDVTLRGSIVRKKDVPTLEPSDEEVPMPKIFFKAHARVVLSGLVKALKDFSALSEHTTITFENDSMTLSQRGDCGSQSTPFEKYGDNLLDIKYEEDTKSTFTESYLDKIVRAIQPLSEVVNIDLSTDMPIKISPELELGTLDFYIAPCIGVGDDEPVRTVTEEKEIEADETAYEPEVTDEDGDIPEATTPTPVAPEEPAPEPVTAAVPTLIPTPIPASIAPSVPEPTPTPIAIDMSILRRIKF